MYELHGGTKPAHKHVSQCNGRRSNQLELRQMLAYTSKTHVDGQTDCEGKYEHAIFVPTGAQRLAVVDQKHELENVVHVVWLSSALQAGGDADSN